MIKKENEKALEVAKKKTSKALVLAEGLKIKNQESLTKAVELLSNIKKVGKLIKASKEKITKPANEILKNARDMFRPVEDQYKEAERIVKFKMVEFNTKEEVKAEKKEEKILAKVEDGQISSEKASEKIENLAPEKTVQSKAGNIRFKTIKEVVIQDESKIPRNYLMPNMVKIRKDALDGQEIAGVKVVEKKIVASSSY